ncbi:MFS transporter [Pacificimonas flava]|uniref:MFS transporter n=3 Tax=Sphingosinicellaceae TaxID=2820280 RepID=A0A219B8E1_9SPHN|nr:MFS transporter [Pacificimonas aurantium]OWV34662.1 MFS transporter [Pacificimonas flava]
MGLFAEPLSQAYGWSRTEISFAVSVMMLSTAVTLPVAGRLVDQFGPKRVLLPSIVLLAACLGAMPFVTAYWQFIAVYLAMGTVAVGTNSVPYMRILTCWFDRSRGLAIGVAGSGTGLGFAYVPIVTELLVGRFGWQGGYVGLALILLLVTLPLAIFVLREQPADMGLSVDGGSHAHEGEASRTDVGMSVTDALRSRDFWVLGLIFVGLAFVLYGLIPHLVPMLTDRGIESGEAAAIASIFGLAAFGGRLLIGFLIDRFDARRIALLFFSLSAVGLLVLALPAPPILLILTAVLLGGSLGAEVDMLAYLTSRYFGLRCFAQIFSVLFSAVMVAMGLGPLAFGMVFDATGSYDAILALGVPICIAANLLVLLLKPYEEQRRGGAISLT